MPDALWMNVDTGAPAYASDELRRAFAMLVTQAVGDKFGARSGVHPAGGNAVSLSGTTVTVLHTKAVAYPGLTSTAGPYICQILSTTHALNPADGANPRKDIVVLRVYDNDEDASGQRTAVTEYIAGTPAASPAEPAVPAGAFRMATVDVPASGLGSPTLTYNAPFTVASGGVLPVRNDAELPGSSLGLYDGMVRWNQATNELQVHNGASTWETVASTGLAVGTVVAHLQRSAAQAFTSTLAGASATAVSWDTEIVDKMSGWDSGTNPNRFTPNLAGFYKLEGQTSFVANTGGGVRGCIWRKNGTPVDGGVSRPHVGTIGNAAVTVIASPLVVEMNGTTDWIELAAMQDSGANLNNDTGNYRPHMTITYVGA